MDKIQVLFCDSVRHEIGDKFSLIGIYDDFCIVPKGMDFCPQMSVFIRLDRKYFIDNEVGFRVQYRDNIIDAPYDEMRAIEQDKSKYINLAFGLAPIRITGKDSLSVFFLSGDDQGDLVASLPIRWDEESDPSESS